MSNDNQNIENQTTSNPNSTALPEKKPSPFLTEQLPQGTAQGQQQTLAQNSTASNQNIPHYNLPRGANTGNVGETTHFGFKTINTEEKAQKVAEVFHSVASKYDLMNDLMSLGIHRLWKRYAIHLSGVRRGQQVLDIAGGTGDLAKVFSREVGETGHVVLSDINESMLNVGRDRLLDAGCTNVDFVLANAETLEPFADNSFDLVTISFGLRNVTDKDAALQAMFRVLKPGGRLLILEFSKPVFEPFSKLYDLYSFTALPLMGKIIANDSESYRYLAESIRMHPDQRTLKGMMENAGFKNCDYHNLTGGIVAVHRGFKL
ncbi:bifunctional demethylmenaquinone methyltransferase/2-methoxy-6-polyprenyl-1,4-benzoquinol methylase UbiE [Acinetobacter populi]|jgi:demethylmenaquinone methyltransferase/2-methoxy-6-polyprenyl-1,4-benzoquinol methylase|uniref:Ubiquinone/menaquinone biosynthesis C-methyltransferase UbiE n=1 Tax=Acinetobacter populi TaxID=1582270 RepID=A0A1Z9Z372_9GAMM|nr:bifunctional demethylmenaquinone methyltransferase/2-methoxy-6-polyprenyl-1,4-benzoquinol methylase UbiE [Acinetobacter populi]MCH4246674.1 bifunctional demethylmenaquinone methyltransferase/2-methoxy-6-polyprenyl-1,4-benzoquinol methylase UbiE [Acinetobacter populi]OUY08889.1 bifunctional demethylmenaquinone methyltransferase/2-methoxy-6-polyprenyl-1,4-benzoquinol methylase [Acinetobacter populi]